MYNIITGKSYPGTQASSRSCAMEAVVAPAGVPVHFKREYTGDTNVSDDSSVPQNKRHRPSCSQTPRTGENSPSPWINNYGAAVIKNSPGPASTDQRYQSDLNCEAGDFPAPSGPSLISAQSQYFGHPGTTPFFGPGQYRQHQSQVYGFGSHTGVFNAAGAYDPPAKLPFQSSVPSSNDQSHVVTDGLQTVGSQNFPYHRHQHEALGPEASPAFQRLPQLQQPIQQVYQIIDTTSFFSSTHGDHSGLGLNSEYQFSFGSVASGYRPDTIHNGQEAFPSALYHQGAGGEIPLANPQIPGAPPSSFFNLPPYPQPVVDSSGFYTNQNFAPQPSRAPAYNPGSLDLGANPCAVDQSHYLHSTNPPQGAALMGGGEQYPGGGAPTSPEENAKLVNIPYRPSQNSSPEQDGLNASSQSDSGTPGTPVPEHDPRSNAPSAEDWSSEEDENTSALSSLSPGSGVEADPTPEAIGGLQFEHYSHSEGGLWTQFQYRHEPPRNADGLTRRRRLNSEERAEAGKTRSLGACIACHAQKEKCIAIDDDPKAPCKRCRDLQRDSAKSIHFYWVCTRAKAQDITLNRSGGLNLTLRWTGVQLKDVGAKDRVSGGAVRSITVSQGLECADIPFKVVEFKPGPGDVIHRNWTDIQKGREVKKQKKLAPYCFESIHETVASFEKYIVTNALPSLNSFFKRPEWTIGGPTPDSPDIVSKTYLMALRHFYLLRTTDSGADESSEASKERTLLGNLFILWFLIRHTTGSFWITSEDTLDMQPETKDQSYPLLNKVSAPRMIVAQFDSVNHKILEKYRKKVLGGFEEMICRSSIKPWMTLYYVMFILLHEVSNTCQDRYRHARQNYGSKIRYSIPDFVESLQEGCNTLLCYWHYYNWRDWPKDTEFEDLWQTHLMYLDAEQRSLVMETKADADIRKQLRFWKREKARNGRARSIREFGPEDKAPYTGSQSRLDWDHRMYWVAQIFEPKWSAHPTYQREPVPKGI